ncbi:MAG: hypothetical protein U9Q78_02395, partial [Chloroflexota bacterium]|nr:hypothetical protein [Chloroflexota bacterium]
MALLMVMGLSLLVYALAERKLRTQLAAHDEHIPDQKGQPTQRSTIRRIFHLCLPAPARVLSACTRSGTGAQAGQVIRCRQMFEGIDVLLISTSTGTERQVLNLEPIHHKILKLLGPYVQNCYLIDI